MKKNNQYSINSLHDGRYADRAQARILLQQIHP